MVAVLPLILAEEEFSSGVLVMVQVHLTLLPRPLLLSASNLQQLNLLLVRDHWTNNKQSTRACPTIKTIASLLSSASTFSRSARSPASTNVFLSALSCLT